jgi:hypothetical protein
MAATRTPPGAGLVCLISGPSQVKSGDPVVEHKCPLALFAPSSGVTSGRSSPAWNSQQVVSAPLSHYFSRWWPNEAITAPVGMEISAACSHTQTVWHLLLSLSPPRPRQRPSPFSCPLMIYSSSKGESRLLSEWPLFLRKGLPVGYQWLMPIILSTQEAEIRSIMVWGQPRQIVHKTLSQKNPSQKMTSRKPQQI